jgi:sugar-specific transcriptional regulator TrmB
MKTDSGQHLQLLNQLAREYQEKFHELEEAIRDMPSTTVLHQLRTYAEMSTDRFRGAQQALLASIPTDREENKDVLRAVTALCRCFDEMRILFQALLDRYSLLES